MVDEITESVIGSDRLFARCFSLSVLLFVFIMNIQKVGRTIEDEAFLSKLAKVFRCLERDITTSGLIVQFLTFSCTIFAKFGDSGGSAETRCYCGRTVL